MEDIEIAQATEKMSILSYNTMQKFNSYDNIIQGDYNNVLNLLENTDRECLDILTRIGNMIPLDKIMESCMGNKDYIKKMEIQIEEVKAMQKDLEAKKVSEEEQINIYKQELVHLEHKQKHLQKLRDKILVYKLHTNTNFIYNSKYIKGYVLGENSDHIECFDINPQTFSQEQIIEKIYSIIKEVNKQSSVEGIEKKRKFLIMSACDY